MTYIDIFPSTSLINADMMFYFYFLILLFKHLNDFESKLVAVSI